MSITFGTLEELKTFHKMFSLEEQQSKKRVYTHPRRTKREYSITGRIQDTIKDYLDSKISFTASDIYKDLKYKDPNINKQSVVTSVLRQMNTTFNKVPVTRGISRGPQPVKIYNT